MKKLILPILLFSFSVSAFAGDDNPKVSPSGVKGFYYSNTSDYVYFADTVAQLCFARLAGLDGIATIPCKNLKKRPEWEKIITWD